MMMKKKSLEGMLDVVCPRCGSEDVRIVESSFPQTYECKKCGMIFTKVERGEV